MIGVSQKVLDCIQKRIDIREKGKVVYNGVDIDKFYPTDKKSEEKYILATGNLIALKGHDDTIKAFAELKKAGIVDIRLKIAGRGPLWSIFASIAGCILISSKQEKKVLFGTISAAITTSLWRSNKKIIDTKICIYRRTDRSNWKSKDS